MRPRIPLRLALPAAVGLATSLALAVGHRDVGYARDEGIYFEAARHYGAWLAQVARAPGRIADREARDRVFAFNREHPALLKLAAGASAAVLARPPAAGDTTAGGGALAWLREGAALRLPAQLLAGLGAALLCAAGLAMGGILPALVAAGSFLLLPHVWFHAGLLAFDVPVAVMTLAVVLCYRRGLREPRLAVASGVVLGLAIATKHNALFLPPVLGVHWLWVLAARARRERRVPRLREWIPLPFLSMATLAPLVAIAAWPWIWHDTVARVSAYVRFHADHAWYNIEYLGRNWNLPPLPPSYPWVMTAATVPAVVLALAGLGLVIALREDLAASRPCATSPGPRNAVRALAPGEPTHDGVLWLLCAVFPLALISWPTIPIFGGTKHWITAYPFFALAAARAAQWICAGHGRGARVALGAAALLPGAVSTMTGHPYGMSQYSALVGGARGAAELGLARGFWGHAVRPLLRELPELAPTAHRLYPHDLHDLAARQYERDGDWPPSVSATPEPRAEAALYFHELHMTTWEAKIWNAFGTTRPTRVLTLHGVPLTSLYVRPHLLRHDTPP